MHILGKTLTWIIVPLALFATALTARMLQVRNSWTKQMFDDQNGLIQKYEDEAKTIKDKSKQLRELRGTIARETRGWGQYWNNVEVNGAGGAAIAITIGSDDGLRDQQVIYGFKQNAEGKTYTYVGPFQVTILNADNATVTATWRFRPAEDANRNGTIDPGEDINQNGQLDPAESAQWTGTWRFREMIPSAPIARFTGLEVRLTWADETLADKRRDLTKQTTLIAGSKLNLDIRKKELLSDPLLQEKYKEGQLDAEFIDGLIETISQEEEARNDVLEDVDQLRRKVKEAYEKYGRLSAANRKLLQSLPGADVLPAADATENITPPTDVKEPSKPST